MLRPKQTILPREKRKVPISMAIGHVELMQVCFPNTRAQEQQLCNKIKYQPKKARREA